MYMCMYVRTKSQGIACTCITATLSFSLSIPFIPPASVISNGETASKKYPDIYQGNNEATKIATMLQDYLANLLDTSRLLLLKHPLRIDSPKF